MDIPQSEIDKLNESSTDGIFGEHEEEEEVKEAEPVVESKEKVSESPDEDSVGDKPRVPYSRFETVNERAIRAEERLKVLEEQAQTEEVKVETDIPKEWIELYGDNDEAKRAYGIQLKLNEQMLEQATEKTYERIQGREKEEQERVESNLEQIEDSLETFQESLGRKLTEQEESALLDVQDEFTPKGEDGKYVAPLISPDKAFEILTLRQNGAKVSKLNAKNRVVNLTGASSDGDISSPSANYNPQAWGSWRDKL
jgi:hypothetical protein